MNELDEVRQAFGVAGEGRSRIGLQVIEASERILEEFAAFPFAITHKVAARLDNAPGSFQGSLLHHDSPTTPRPPPGFPPRSNINPSVEEPVHTNP